MLNVNFEISILQ